MRAAWFRQDIERGEHGLGKDLAQRDDDKATSAIRIEVWTARLTMF